MKIKFQPYLKKIKMINTEISKYIAKSFMISTSITLAVFASIIFIGDMVEYSKKLSSQDEIYLVILFQLCVLNLPKMLFEIMPFVLLFSGLLWTIRIKSYKELLIMRTTGVSLLQICLPLFLVTIFIGITFVGILSPIISATQKKIQRIESEKLNKPLTSILVSNTGFWLKQGSNNGSDIIYAKRLDARSSTLFNVLVYRFNKNYEVQERITAESSELVEKSWLLKNLLLTNRIGETEKRNYMKLPTYITNSQIKEGFSSPETISLWNLVPFIKMFDSAGFSTKKHRLYLYKLITFPLYLAGMSLLGISFNIQNIARKSSNFGIFIGTLVGFIIFYLTKIIGALAISGKISLFFSALLPALIPLMLGVSFILYANER